MHDRANQLVASDSYAKASDEKRSLMIMNLVNQYRDAWRSDEAAHFHHTAAKGKARANRLGNPIIVDTTGGITPSELHVTHLRWGRPLTPAGQQLIVRDLALPSQDK